jgi:hypothetical protein
MFSFKFQIACTGCLRNQEEIWYIYNFIAIELKSSYVKLEGLLSPRHVAWYPTSAVCLNQENFLGKDQCLAGMLLS